MLLSLSIVCQCELERMQKFFAYKKATQKKTILLNCFVGVMEYTSALHPPNSSVTKFYHDNAWNLNAENKYYMKFQ